MVGVGIRRRVGVSNFYNFCRISNVVFPLFMYFFSLPCYISNCPHIFCIYFILPQKQCFSEVPTSNISALSYRDSCEISSPRPVFSILAINVRFLKVIFLIQLLYSLPPPPAQSIHGASQPTSFYSLHL